jgi:hypothetical protein
MPAKEQASGMSIPTSSAFSSSFATSGVSFGGLPIRLPAMAHPTCSAFEGSGARTAVSRAVAMST